METNCIQMKQINKQADLANSFYSRFSSLSMVYAINKLLSIFPWIVWFIRKIHSRRERMEEWKK